MKHKIHTSNNNGNGYTTKPRLELLPFLGQRRLLRGTFNKSRPVQSGYRIHRNAEFIDVYDVVTGTPVAVRSQNTNSHHMWIMGVDWPNQQWPMAELTKGTEWSFIGEVAEYTTPQKDYIDYCAIKVSEPLDWGKYDKNMDILAEYDAGCPDSYDCSPEYSTFIPCLGNSQNPNIDGSEIPMNH